MPATGGFVRMRGALRKPVAAMEGSRLRSLGVRGEDPQAISALAENRVVAPFMLLAEPLRRIKKSISESWLHRHSEAGIACRARTFPEVYPAN